MAREFSRTERVADHLQRELATLIQQEIRDPRVGMVSVTAVKVSRDLSHARVYVTRLGSDSEEEAKPGIEALNGAAGYLRSQLARSTTMRTVPRLRFVFDASIGRGRHMEALISAAADADARHHEGDAAAEPDDSPDAYPDSGGSS
uniref:Ribosome-binding factor A n=1 Tax=Haliea sp. ETY-M TaxID=1055105 RepID=A0A455R591_9GAMM|nr:ribosome-binding factor A [Haliea sp. ETY-M]